MEFKESDERLNLPSASSMARTHICAGWLQLYQSIPVDQRPAETTEAAESGIRIHAAVESDETDNLDMTEAEIASRLSELEQQSALEWLPQTGAVALAEVEHIKEKRLWIRDAAGQPLASARVDSARIFQGWAMVCDLKTGFLQTVPAARNHQMKLQAVALRHEYGVSHVRVVIAAHRFRSHVTAADFDEDALQMAEHEIAFDLWRASQPDAARVPSSECTYCPAKAFCPEAATYAILPSRYTIGTSKQEIEATVAGLTPQDLALIENRRLVIEKILEACKARLKRLPTNELAALGFELAPGRAQMEIKDPGAIIAWLESEGLLKEDEITGVFKLIHGTMEEIVVPRMVANPIFQITSEKAARAFLREKFSKDGWVNYTASRTEAVLKQL